MRSEARKPTDDQKQPIQSVRVLKLGETEAAGDGVAEAEKQRKHRTGQDDGAPAPPQT